MLDIISNSVWFHGFFFLFFFSLLLIEFVTCLKARVQDSFLILIVVLFAIARLHPFLKKFQVFRPILILT